MIVFVCIWWQFCRKNTHYFVHYLLFSFSMIRWMTFKNNWLFKSKNMNYSKIPSKTFILKTIWMFFFHKNWNALSMRCAVSSIFVRSLVILDHTIILMQTSNCTVRLLHHVGLYSTVLLNGIILTFQRTDRPFKWHYFGPFSV